MTNEYDDLINEESSSQSLKPTNEYDDFFKEESTFKKQEVQQNIYQAKDKLPDQQAEYLKLSKELNMPLGVVERNYDRLKKKKEIETVDYDGLVKKNPSVSNWLSKPENAAIGHDDIDSLKRVETYSKFRLPQPKKTFREELEASLPAQYVPAAQTGMNNLSAGTVALAASFGKMNKEEAAAYIANFASLNQDIQNKIPSFAKEFQEVMAKEGEEFDNAASELADKYYNLEKDFGLNTLKEFGSGAINTVGEGLGYFYELGSRPKGLAYMSIENLTRMTPSFVAGALGAKAGASLALLAGQAGPQAATPEEIATVPLAATVGAGTGFFISNTAIETGAWLQDKVLKRVKDPTNQDQILAVLNDEKFMAEIQGEALRKGVTTAAVDTMFSLVAGSFLAKSKIGQTQGVLPKVGVAAKEVGQELAVQTTGEMLSEFGGQVAAFKGDISQVSPSDVLAEGMLSMGTSVVDVAMGVSRRAYYDTKAFKAAEQVAQDTKIAFESAQNAEMLDQLNGSIVESKVAQRSPEAIGDLIATATQGQAEAVFFQDDEWDSYWTSRGESPAQKLTEITGDPTLHQRVKNEGVDLVIPLKDYMTKLAGTEDINQLNKLARVSPDSMNLAEAREHFKDLNATVKDIASEADAQIAEVNKVKEMQDRFYNEYKATGVRPEQAKSYAVMNTAFYETMASRLDMPVDELYKLYPLRISSETAQVESVGEFSQEIKKAPPFYSKLKSTMSQKIQGKSATVDQVKALLKDIKAEEVEWSGINNFLKGKTKVDTKELLDYLDANQVRIVDVTLGGEKSLKPGERVYRLFSESGEWLETFIDYDNAQAAAEKYRTDSAQPTEVDIQESEYPDDGETISDEDSIDADRRPTKYEQYTLPGGENYREVLFTLPSKDPIGAEAEKQFKEYSNELARKYDLNPEQNLAMYGSIKNMDDAEIEKYESLQRSWIKERDEKKANTYRSSHFNQANILAHVRLNDRTDKDGNRVLFVEEIQSDWHQAGRKKGYKVAGLEQQNFKDWMQSKYPDKENIADLAKEKFNNKEDVDFAAYKEEQEMALKNARAVPDAPFKKTWHEFAFKNIIRMAAENGYDKIAWTTGEQQAERFDLSKKIDNVTLTLSGETEVLRAFDLDGSEVMAKSESIGFDWSDYIGKEAADKLSKQEWGSKDKKGLRRKVLANADLKVGGEGMKGFYDKILVQYANKLGKKMDAKVESLNIPRDESTPMQAISINDFRSWMSSNHPDELVMPSWESKDKLYQEYLQSRKSEGFNVHSIPVTDKMKEIALGEGFELFQEGKRGKISFFKSEEARRGAVIELMKAKDFSTALHESGHFFLEVMADLNDQENTPQEIKDDFKVVMDWMGVTDRSQIGVEQHEMWAETVEAYFMTGNAPSNKLKKIFNQFKAWLVSIYKNLGPQRAKLTPEIKSVMDRLLATEIEIEQAKDQVNFKPMFGKDLEKFGLTGERAKRYKDAVVAAEDAAGEILTARLLNAKEIKEQKEWREREQAEREAVTEQVNSLKVYKTIDAIKEKRDDGTNLKLSKDSLLKYIEKEDLKKLTGLYTVDGGMDVAEASGLFGYADSIEMIDDLLKSGKKKEVIEAMTQARLAEKYPEVDPFFDEKKMNEESLAAVHNEHREKLMEMELEILFEQNKPVVKDMIRQTAKRPPKSKDVKAIAEKIIGRLTLENIRPVVYERSEAKAAKLAGEALAKGDLNKAYEYKKKEQVNYYLYKEALRAKEEIKKAKQSFKKVNKKDADLSKSRDLNFVNAARALLARFGISKANKTPQDYLDSMSKYDPAAYDTMMTLVDSVESQADSVEKMSFEEFKILKDTVDALWEMAKTSREIEVDGKKMRKEDALLQLKDLILKYAKPGVKPGYEKAMTKWEKTKMSLLNTKSALRRVESFFDSFGDDNAFKRIIFYPIREATNKYRAEKVTYMKEFRELLRPIEKSLTGKEIKGSEINYTFKDKAELLGAMLHTGNISNKQKLLRGRGWGELDENNNLISDRWDNFVGRMITEGVLTKADFDFMQNVWDLFERTKPMAQRAHKAMYGHYFDEITADEFSFGFPDGEIKKYRGGYMPAKADPNIVEDASIRQEKDALEKFNNSYAFPTTGRGATKKRVEEYAAPLIFDLRQVPQHLDWVLRFSIIEPRVKDAAKIIMDSEFRNTLAQLDPSIGSSLLVPWLQRAATQVVEEPIKKSSGWDLISKGAKALRSRTGLGIMMGNIVNTFQQVTGFSIAALKVKRKHLRNAAWRYINDSKGMGEAITDKSEFMKTRISTQVFDVSREVEELLLNPTKYEKAKDFAAKHGYFLQQHAQNVVDNIVWSGAYEQAVEAGKDETQAVRDADEAVRLTQGSFDPEDLSTFESGSALQRFFTMFYSYFNMQANILGTEYVKIMRNGGVGKNKGRAVYVYTMGFMIPAVMSELIVKGMSGALDEDDDDEYLDDVMSLFFGSQIRTGTAMFPFVGPAVQTGFNMWNDKWYDDKLSTSPAISMLESTVRSPYSVYKAISEGKGEKRAVRDTLTAIQMITGLPTMTLARPASYLIDVETGKANPTGPIDFTRGLITGKSGE